MVSIVYFLQLVSRKVGLRTAHPVSDLPLWAAEMQRYAVSQKFAELSVHATAHLLQFLKASDLASNTTWHCNAPLTNHLGPDYASSPNYPWRNSLQRLRVISQLLLLINW